MESYLNENFGEVKAKNSPEEALQRWRKLSGLVKKRRFRSNEIFLALYMAVKAIRSLNLQVILGWTFILINLTLESLSAFLDQMSSPQRPQYALLAMTVSFVTLLVCILELVYRIRKEKAVWRKFWFCHPSPPNRPLGTFADNLGLICAASQCLFSTIQFVFYSHHEDNPIKLSIFPIVLAVYAVYSYSTKKVDVITKGDAVGYSSCVSGMRSQNRFSLNTSMMVA